MGWYLSYTTIRGTIRFTTDGDPFLQTLSWAY